MLYKKIIKPALFKFEPEKIHDLITKIGSLLGKSVLTRTFLTTLFCYKHKSLNQSIDGIKYENPIGLAAGFDKNANLTKILPSIGFGFEEIGSITALPCQGNPKPRLWRLPKHKSLVVYYGLKNIGCKAIAKKLYKQKKFSPLGISIAKTNCKKTTDTNAAIQDYYKSFITLEPFADYLTINISCPNTFGGQPFTSKKLLKKLLTKLDQINSNKPRYIKISPDLTKKQINNLLLVSKKHKIQGFIISNLLKNRKKSGIPKTEFSKVGKGGLSGKPVEKISNTMLSYIHKKTKGKYTLIGCGGIFNAEDAYKKIKAGASLIQLITGMIYEGPTLIKNINKDLVKLLKKDGFTNIKQAIGTNHHPHKKNL